MEFASGGYGQGFRTRCDGFASELSNQTFIFFLVRFRAWACVLCAAVWNPTGHAELPHYWE